MNKDTIDIIKQTIPVLREHGKKITKKFYQNMLSEHPELKNIFNMEQQMNNVQPDALALTLVAAAENIDNLEKLGPAVTRIARKHVSLHVTPEQYDIVGKHLLRAIKEVLGAAATDAIINAWAEVYGILAKIFIDKEECMYEEIRNNKGWVGYKPAKVSAIESQGNKKIVTLEPPTGHSISTAKEYISVIYPFPNVEYTQPRQLPLAGDCETFSVVLTENDDESKKMFAAIAVGDTLQITYPV